MVNKMIGRFLPVFLLVFLSGFVNAQDTYTNGIGMEFVLIKPGSMTVGKFEPTVGKSGGRSTLPASAYELAEKMAKEAYMSGFKVTIDQPYFIGKFEVTQEQWIKVMGKNPSVFQGDKVAESTDNHPVDNISWKDAQAFVRKLNKLDKTHKYRLPTEFEWEYAARAGAVDDIPWTEIRATAVLGGVNPIAVGQKKPNAWGLYDMLGNVWEWTQDYYNERIFADPIPPKSGKEHVLKGASFVGDVKNATYMTHAAGPGNRYDIGLRIVMESNFTSPVNAQIPAGFTPIFNGRNLEGWHISRTTHQGTTPNFRAEDGMIVVTQNPYGQGGILLTDRKYKNFDLYLEAKIDSFSNGGIFIRSSESGVAYQIEFDETAGSTGNLLSERMPISKQAKTEGREKVWKENDWNSFRIRMEGEIPHITLWINGVQMWDVTQPKNDFIAGVTEGMIGLQSHWTALFSSSAGDWNGLGSWQPGAMHRYRNIAIKELP